MHISHHLPRDPLAFKGQIDFWKGLRGYFIYGPIYLMMAIVFIVSCFYPPFHADTIIFKSVSGILIFWGVAFGMFRYVHKKHKERIQAFTHGQLVTGIVIAQGSKLTPRKSKKDFTISIAIHTGGDIPYIIESRKADKIFHTDHPIQSEITMLFDSKTKSAFIPTEVDIEIE